ncbi:hypothetical protein [Agarivorans sp. Alg241-V36]|uniref:hypothetical protein n=1 Tax=Agarivorans sp. Alg241-V36 TaxID=2305992 RepID=UPI0013D3D7BA|nr:hypothetical protein [Agarivorans sp. Alg241-V36]
MKVYFFLLILVFGFPVASLAEESNLSKIFNLCLSKPLDDCRKKLIGQPHKINNFLLPFEAVKVSFDLKQLYIESYGIDEYDKFSSTFGFEASLIDYDQYSSNGKDDEREIYIGEDGSEIVIIWAQQGWRIDLDLYKLPLGLEKTESEYELLSQFVGLQKLIIEMIRDKATSKKVYAKTGLYYMSLIYDLVSQEQQENFNDYFKSADTDLNELRNTIKSYASG